MPRFTTNLRPFEALHRSFLRRCSSRGKECQLDFDQFVKFTEQTTCHYCTAPIQWRPYTGRKVSFGKRNVNGRSYFLDRKDNLLPYTMGNVVVACWECNSGKGDRFSYEEWKAMAQALKDFRKIQENNEPITEP